MDSLIIDISNSSLKITYNDILFFDSTNITDDDGFYSDFLQNLPNQVTFHTALWVTKGQLDQSIINNNQIFQVKDFKYNGLASSTYKWISNTIID
jgi:hypothetical protein